MMKITSQYQLFKKAPCFTSIGKITPKIRFNPYWVLRMAGSAVVSSFYRKKAYAVEEATKTKPWYQVVRDAISKQVYRHSSPQNYYGNPLRSSLEKKILTEIETLSKKHPETFEGAVQVPSEEEILFKDHPLKNLVQKIEAKRVVLINPTTGEKQDFSAYFRGYGKRLVKGAKLRFEHKVTKEGSHVTELHFRINDIYKERVLQHLDVLHKLSPEEAGQFAASLKGKKLTVKTKEITERIQGWRNWEDQLEISFHVEDVGDLFLNFDMPDWVKVSLKGEQDIEGFHKFLKAFNLEEALTISTPQDLEKRKLKFLFKFFYPPEADKLKKEEAFFQLSPEDLKQKIIEIAPEMKKHFETYQIQETEILPGFARYSIPIDKEVRALGGRALTATLTNKDSLEVRYSYSLTADHLDRIANIVKHGMLSMSMRRMASINKNGINLSERHGAANSIFTQMVWQGDVDKQKNLTEFEYDSDIRLYFSLKALNRGSYQYDIDRYGTKSGSVYSNRKNILDFIRFFPFDSGEAKAWHEVMIPGRILPEEVRAVNVRTQKMRKQLVAHFKKHDIIQISGEGKETVHGIPLDDFILVEKSISPKTVENCSDV